MTAPDARQKEERQQAEQRGRLAETAAALRLMLSGYRILARRFRSPVGEIDIVARRGRLVAFVEVKARASLAEAEAAAAAANWRRIGRAADAFLARHPRYAGCDLRYDAVLVAGLRLPRHRCDIWRP